MGLQMIVKLIKRHPFPGYSLTDIIGHYHTSFHNVFLT